MTLGFSITSALPAANVVLHDGVLQIEARSHDIPLRSGMAYFRTESNMTLQDILIKDQNGEFKKSAEALKSYGESDGYIWLKFLFHLKSEYGNWILSSRNTGFSEFVGYGPYKFDYQKNSVFFEGSPAAKNKTLETDFFSYGFLTGAPGEYVVYIKTRSSLPENYDFYISDALTYSLMHQKISIAAGVCYGLLICMITCSMVLYQVFREKVYVYNVACALFALVTISLFSGHFQRYVHHFGEGWLQFALVAAPSAWIACSGLFGSSFLELEKYTKYTAALIKITVNMAIGAILFALLKYYDVALTLLHVSLVVGPVLIWCAAFRAYLRGFLPALFYLIGLAFLYISAVAIAFNNFGFIPSIDKAAVLQFGASMEALIFLVALGSRISRLRALNGILDKKALDMAEQALRDPLTGSYNRNGWKHHAQSALEGGSRSAILLIDLDGFKTINDTHGHAIGDKVLVEIVQRLRTELEEEDVLARIGGDEFVVLMYGTTDKEILDARVEMLLKAIQLTITLDQTKLNVGASIGVSCYPDDGNALSELMRAADSAMYYVKNNGKCGYSYYLEMSRF